MIGLAVKELSRSDLVRRGGVAVVPLDGFDGLRAEAHACAPFANEVRQPAPPNDPWDRGNPDRWLESATGGGLLNSLMHSPALIDVCRALAGLDVRPLGERASYSYYRRPGHFLGVHRDIRHCDLAVIVVCEADGVGGDLLVYPGRAQESVTAIRRTPSRGARPVEATAGSLIVLLGGHVAHRVVPVRVGGLRVVAPLCYRMSSLTPRPPSPWSVGACEPCHPPQFR